MLSLGESADLVDVAHVGDRLEGDHSAVMYRRVNEQSGHGVSYIHLSSVTTHKHHYNTPISELIDSSHLLFGPRPKILAKHVHGSRASAGLQVQEAQLLLGDRATRKYAKDC